jgi:hypothetical protein
MVGRYRANTLIQNEWAFDILLEIRDLLDAAAPTPSWLQHDGHGETDEHAVEDNATPVIGITRVIGVYVEGALASPARFTRPDRSARPIG